MSAHPHTPCVLGDGGVDDGVRMMEFRATVRTG